MVKKRDYYEILGVSKNASEQELKKAYRKLAHEHHPDKNAGDKKSEELFKEASEAYAVLSDPDKRARYDRFGHQGLQEGMDGFSVNIQDIFSEFFGDVFGGTQNRGRRSRRQSGQPGNDLRYELAIAFEEAAFGTEKAITFKRREACDTCHGDGAKPGSTPTRCKSCGGAGEIHVSQGFFAVSQTCPSCRGAGQIITERCPACRGALYKMVERDLKVKIPPGIETGMQLRVPSEGEGGLQGGPAGDLYVAIQVQAHAIFTREENNIRCEVPISFATAALGSDIEVPTLEGKVSLHIPAGTQTGTVFKLRHKGIPLLRRNGSNSAEKGDELVQVKVEVPKRLTAHQKELLMEFFNLSEEDDHPDSKSFFSKVKDLFG